MILDRYLVGQITRPLVVFLLVLVLIFVAYSASQFLADASSGYLKSDVVVRLVLLRTAVALEVLLPISLYLTVVVGLARLGDNQELVAMAACGYGGGRLIRALSVLFLVVGLLGGVLSLYLRPLAYAMSYEIQDTAASSLDFSAVRSGRFHAMSGDDRVIYVDSHDAAEGVFHRVFVWSWDEPSPLIVVAREAHYEVDAESRSGYLTLRRLHAHHDDGSLAELSSDELTIEIFAPSAEARHKRKAAATAQLARSMAPKDMSELQWRVTRPVSTLLLGLLAVFIGISRPQADRYGRIVVAVLGYVAYYQCGAVARTWMEEGVVGHVPGIWWVDALLAVLLAVGFSRRRSGP